MLRRGWDRERVLALLWLVGALLSALTMVLPYEAADLDRSARGAIAALALATGLGLLAVPRLPESLLHAVVAMGTLTIGVCTSLAVADVEGVILLLPVIFAFASFSPRHAAAHLALAAAVYATVLLTADEGGTVAPWVSFTMVLGVGAVAGVAIALLVAARERAVEAGRRDRHIAETLQRSLLPETLPSPPGLALAARYVPAAQEADVGGDLYDVIELPGGRVAVAIGDVAGKGLEAAAMVGRVRSALRAYALEEPTPAAVLGRLSRLLTGQPDATRMTTLLYAVVDPAEGTLGWASAGHPPPLLLPHDGPPRYLEVLTGVPLGVLPRAHFAQETVALAPGDRLLLYTDGLVERRGASLAEGMERLAADAPRLAGAIDPDALLDAALQTVAGPQRDDVAVLAVALAPLGDRLELDVPARPEALAGLRGVLRRWLEKNCPGEAADDLLRACSEVATNAVMHASGEGERPFHLKAEARDDRVRVSVRDHGPWRAATEDDHGRGLQLARALVDHLEVRTTHAGTTVVLERRAGAGRPAPSPTAVRTP